MLNWISVKYSKPDNDDDYFVTDGECCAVAYVDKWGEWIPSNVGAVNNVGEELLLDKITHYAAIELPLRDTDNGEV
jgi:hypothetical protein